jgi:uncharacterized membrane protein
VASSRKQGAIGLVASSLGLFFAGYSSHDFISHLDRQLHGTHCSFIPGLGGVDKGENACSAAMYSTYSALFRDKYWGGIPISLFALGFYALFFALSLYLLLAKDRASRRMNLAFGLAGLSPLPVTIFLFAISLTELGQFCKLCVGLYISSILLAVASVIALLAARVSKRGGASADATVVDPEPWHQKQGNRRVAPTVIDEAETPAGSFASVPIVFALSAFFSALPSLVYAGSLPDYKPLLLGCGKAATLTEPHGALVKIPTLRPKQAALTFEDPLCPTCKAFHKKLTDEKLYEELDLRVAIFPLDNECNWMLDKAVHPGACVLARAFLCGEKSGKSRQILEWSYDNQEDLTAAGKAGGDTLAAKVKTKFPDVADCIDTKETKKRLDHVLQFAVANKIRVSTPQLFLGETRVCDEDTDLGLRFTFAQLAPEVKP